MPPQFDSLTQHIPSQSYPSENFNSFDIYDAEISMPPPEGTIVTEKAQTSFFTHLKGLERNHANQVDDSDTSSTDSIEILLFCISCGNETSGAHRCPKCKGCIHVFCGRSEEEGYGYKVWCKACDLNTKNKECNEMHAGIKRSQEKCYERMLRASGKRFKPAEVDDAVVLPIPHPDRLCAIGPRNILGSIHEKRDDTYTIATSEGLISGGYSRNQFEIQSSNLITTPFSSTRIISQTELMQNASLGAGIGACRCKKCINRKCPCRNTNKNCSTKCHKGRMCSNKEQ